MVAIITIAAAVSTPIFLNYLTVGEVFRSYPEYEVTAELISSDVGDFSRLTITNTGSVQAKEVKIHVISDDTIKVKQILCFEAASFNNTDDRIFRIDFTTLSSNIPCKIDFVGQIQIPEIAITSIDSPGRYFSSPWKTEFPMFDERVLSDSSEQTFGIEVIVLLEIVILIPIYGILILRLIMIKKQLQSKQKKLQVVLYKAKSELKIISDYASKDKDVIKNKIRMMELHDNIRNTNHDLDEVKSKLTHKIPLPYINKTIAQLFENWRTIEYDLALMAKDINIENTSQPLDKLVQELRNKNRVSDDFVKSFNDAYSVRNKIVHGELKKLFRTWNRVPKLIQNQIKIIQNLRNVIDNSNNT